MRSLIIAVSIAMLSATCSAGQGFFGFGGSKPSAVDGFNFGYQINDGKPVGLLQAFDDGKRVYFQFRELDLKEAPQVWSVDSAGNRHPVVVEATTPYIVAESIERKFVFMFGKGKSIKEATVTRLSADVPAHPMSAKQTDQQSTRIDSVPSKRDSLRQQDYIAQCQSDPALSPTARVVNVPFGNGAEEPTKRAQDDIRTLARKIQESGRDVTIRGRPSGPDDFALARSRANSIRAILMQGGVAPNKITLTTDSSPKPGGDVFYSEIIYNTSSSGFVLLNGC